MSGKFLSANPECQKESHSVGHRANYIVIESGKQALYFSNWGALNLAHDIFFGPETTVPFLRTHLAKDTLLDEVYCEGAALLDLDHKRLIFFSWHVFSDPLIIRHYTTLLQKGYPGWNIQYASEGIIEICRYMERDTAEVTVEDDFEVLSDNGPTTTPPLTDKEAIDRIEDHLLSADSEALELKMWLENLEKSGLTFFPHARYTAPPERSVKREAIRRLLTDYRFSLPGEETD
jgi:hypothetical protein